MALGRADHNACLFIMLAYLTTSSYFKLDSNLLYEIQFFNLLCKLFQGYVLSIVKTWSSSLRSFLFIRKGRPKQKETKSRLKKRLVHQLLTHWKGCPRKDNNKNFNRLHKVMLLMRGIH